MVFASNYRDSEERLTMNRVMVVGANGFLGRSLVKLLQSIECTYISTSSKPSSDQELRFNFFNPDFAALVNWKPDLVICCAHVFDSPITNEDVYRSLRAELGPNVRFIYISSFSAATNVLSDYAQSKIACEKVFMDQIILRPGLIIGAGGLFAQMCHKIKNAWLVPLIDGGRDRVFWIAVEDLLTQIRGLLSHKGPYLAHCLGPRPHTLKEIVNFIRLGSRHALFISIPSALLLKIIFVAEVLKLKLPIKRDNVEGLKKNSLINTDELPGVVLRGETVFFRASADAINRLNLH